MSTGGRFHVSVHDAAPCWAAEIATVIDALRPRVGDVASAAVVPCWHGRCLGSGDRAFTAMVGGAARELLVHGWSHRQERRRGIVSLVTGDADEFSRLPADEAAARVARGADVVRRAFGRPADGFLPPAFVRGRLDPRGVRRSGLRFLVGFARLTRPDGSSVPLATTCWDMGRVTFLSRCGEWAGRLAAIRRHALPIVAIHPADVRRGLLGRAVATIDRLLGEGRTPLLLRDVAARRETGP